MNTSSIAALADGIPQMATRPPFDWQLGQRKLRRNLLLAKDQVPDENEIE